MPPNRRDVDVLPVVVAVVVVGVSVVVAVDSCSPIAYDRLRDVQLKEQAAAGIAYRSQ